MKLLTDPAFLAYFAWVFAAICICAFAAWQIGGRG